MNEYTIQLDSTTDAPFRQESFHPNWAGIVLSLAFFGVVLMFAVKQMFGTEPFRQTYNAFKRLSVAVRAVILVLFTGVGLYGGLLDKEDDMSANLDSGSSRPVAFLRSPDLTASAPAAVEFTESQQLAGFALAAVVTNESFDLSAPTNAVVHDAWRKRGASEDGFWAALDGFPLGTNRRDAVYVSSSGTLSFNRPKSSPSARPMPDGSSIDFLAPLQTVLGIPPQARWNAITNYELQITNSLFWCDITASGSARFTWQNALLDRATNAPVSFQAELFPSGDFIFRYDFTSLAASRWPLAPYYVIGAQNGSGTAAAVGGETALIATDAHACSATNHLCALLYSLEGTNVLTTPLCSVVTNSPKFSLRWTAFGDYDPADPDPDGDGIATPDEVLLHHTNPSMPDTDLDGVSDGGELAAGTGPLLRDTDGDGLVDGADPDPLSATSPDDLDGDGIPDAYETAMFGSTNVVNDLDHDPNGTGFPLSTKIAAGMDPAATPAEATIPLDNLESLKLFDGFRCDFTNAPRVVYSRTFDIDRDGGWQQYFLSSAPDKAGAWKLDGMVLEWEDSAGGSGTATASPRDDSFRIPVSTNSPSQLTLALRATSTNSTCPQPLYLLTWSPGISISGATQAVIDGALCQAVEWEGADGSVDLLYDLSNRPCKAGPFAAELAARLNPLPGDSRLVFTPDGSHTGGSLTAKAPGAYAMPWGIVASGAGTSISMPSSELVPMKAAAAGEGGGACRLLFFDPFMTYGDGHSGGCGSTLVFDTATGTYVASYDYPLDSRCLRDNWRRDSSGAYPCTCQAEIFYGDDSLKEWFTEDIQYDVPGFHAIGTILFGGISVWSGEATHHVDDECHDPFSDGCDGCFSGCADGNCDDLEGDDLGSLAFRIPLGMPREGQVSGFLWFKAEEPFLVTPAIFNLLIRDDANVVAVTNNGLRHVTCSDERGRTAVIDDIPGGVRITLRKTADNSLEHTWIITNSTSSVVHIKKISRLNNVMRDVTYTYVPEDEWATPPSWTRRDNIAQSSELVTREDGLNDPHTGYLQETRVVRDAADAILSHDVVGSRRFGIGQKAVLREVYHATLGLQPNGEPGLIYDSASYWTDDDHPRRNGRPRLVWGESRPWSYQAWDDKGREILRLDQWDGSEVPLDLRNLSAPSELADLAAYPAISAIATVSDYAPLPGDSDAPADIDAVRTESRHLVRGGVSTLIGRTWRIYTHGTDTVGRAFATVQTIRAGSQTAALGDPGNAVSIETRYDADAPGIPLLLRGRPVTSTDEDGITTTYDYVFGVYDSSSRAFTPGGAETALRTLVSRSTAAAPDGIPGKSTQTLTIQDAVHGTTLYTATLLQATGAVLDWQANAYDDKNRLRSTLYSDGSSTTNAYSCCRLLWKIDRNGYTTLRSAKTGEDHLYYAMEEISLRDITENHPDYSVPTGAFRVTQHFMDAVGRETNTVVKTSYDEGAAESPTFSGPPIPCFTETTLYPYGTSDYSVQTDRLGIRTLSAHMTSAQCETTVTQTFSPTNYVTPSTVSTNIGYRNGHSISEQHWEGQWTRESQFTDYDEGGRRFDISVTEASDYTAPVTNRISICDFLGRTVLTVTPMGTVSNAYDGAASRLVSTTSSTPSTSSTTTFLYDDLGDQVGTLKHGIADASETRYESIDNEIWRVTTQSRTAGGVTGGVSVVRSQMTGLSNSLRSRTVSTSANGMASVSLSSFDPETKVLATTTQTGNATPATTLSKYGVVIETQDRSARTLYYHDAFLLSYQVWTYKPGDELLTRRYMEEIDERTWQPLRTSTRLGETENCIHDETAYDAFGQVETQTDDLGNSTTHAYDVFGRTVVVSGDTYPVRYGYDTMGRMKELRTTRDGSAFDATRWLYNPVTGLVTNKLYADDSTIVYAYTDDGKPHRTTWARGAWKETAYDSRELLVAQTYSDDTPDVEYSYNAFGSVTNVSDGAGRNTAFSLNSRQTATNETITGEGSAYAIRRDGDEYERPLETELAENGTNRWLTTYGYDNENDILSIACTNAAGRGFIVEYTNDCGYALGYKVALSQGDVFTRTVQRDSYRRNLIASCGNAFNGTPVKSSAYSYDTLNRVTRRIDEATVTNTFDYNARSEVAAASILSKNYTFAYDFIGNHTTSSVDSVVTTFNANALNQYTSILCAPAPLREPFYDFDGNMLTNGVFSYSWDAENRLVSVSSNGNLLVSNEYDYRHRRVRKTTPQATHDFIYDGWNLVRETIAPVNGPVLEVEYFWGVDLSGTLHGAGGVGGLIAVSIGGNFYFPCYDNNGNATAYADESGNLVAEYTYDAFGRTISQTGSMTAQFRFRFSTKYYDSETELYYYGYRFYSPVIYRWLNRDPIEEDGGLNSYGFCGNDGVSRRDVLGLKWHVKREGKPYAIAYADQEGDTFDDLGRIVGLDTKDYSKWAHTTDATPVRCKKYEIPNRIVYHYGTKKKRDNLKIALYRQRQKSSEKEIANLKSKGNGETFLIETKEDVSDEDITAALRSDFLYQYTFIGHGGPNGGQINTWPRGGVDPTRYTKYGINQLALFACYSADNDVDRSKDALASKYRYNLWEWNVAKRGWFFGYEGEANLLNEIFRWGAAQGRNIYHGEE